ncbi:dihydrofolate reductase family protein [Rhodococcus sp. G-MC3]|uniref:dihydrofolate reductase family protein n=1 Tax=Rhodococcus sp. G-MC3 TaxID=3046209 RepID=UPI0024B94954|nr:dihydrofolate reductase family protein [Rhodococcus sp. G-MC3]MDJ0391817.1 dihydrofolate reductase family protein [Rhodococcus sp. G-MC3]
MRKVTAGLFHSVDGVVEAPNEWQFDSFDSEMGEGLTAMMERVDTVILGRVGYQEWSGYWPTTVSDFAAFINPVPKFVASSTLTGDLAWENSTLIESDVHEFVASLKQSTGGDIAVCAGITVVRSLFFAGLIDSLTLMTHPVVVGRGRRIFQTGDPLTRLELQCSRMTSAGNAILSYGIK